MSVDFEGNRFDIERPFAAPNKNRSVLAEFMLKKGWAKDEKEATLRLIIISLVFFALAFILPVIF